MIELKNIDLSKVTEIKQCEKANEEFNEFKIALVREPRENAIEEFWDVVQSCVGLAEKMKGINAAELMEGYPKHLEKIKNRPR